MATKRTPKAGEVLPATVPVANSTRVRLTQVKFICTACAHTYCPNFLQYATLTDAVIATLDKKQPCDICHSRNQVGVTDPANYGGIHPYFEK